MTPTSISAEDYRKLAAPREKRGRAHPEDKLQIRVVTYLRAVLIDCIVFAIPNGGARSKVEASVLKATGVLAGIPDLCILAPQGRVHFLELKASKGKLSKVQRDMKYRFICHGIPHAVVKSIDEVRIAIKAWGLASREVTA